MDSSAVGARKRPIRFFPKADLLRHAVAAALFYADWQILARWYLFENRRDYFLFVALFLLGFWAGIWPFLRPWIRESPASRRGLVAVLLFLALPWAEWLGLSTKATRENWTEQIFVQLLFLYGAFLVFRLFPEVPSTIRHAALKILSRLSSRAYCFWIPSILFFCFAGWIALFVYKQVPVIQDSAAHLFQAKIFSHLSLFAPAPTVPDFFSYSTDALLMKEGRWFSIYFPGFAALLALGVPFGVEWLVSPLLGAGILGIWIAYARRYHGSQVAILLGLLLLFSPFLLLMCSAVMVHTAELFVVSAVIYLCRRQTEQERGWRNMALLAALMWVILIRSFSALPLLLPVLGYTIYDRRRARSYWCPAAIAAGITTGICLLMYYQWKTTGDPLLPAYRLEVGAYMTYGFGRMAIGEHTPLKGLENISNNVLGLNYWLSGWYIGSLFFLVVFFLREPQMKKWDVLLLLGCCGLALFYFFFFAQDLFFGPRYYFVFTPILLMMIARTIASEELNRFEPTRDIVTALAVLCLIGFLPGRLPGFIHRYDPSSTQAAKLKTEIRKLGEKKTLIFLDKNVSQALINWNDPFLSRSVILCRDFGERNKEAIATFPSYQPVYFRSYFSFVKGRLDSGFRLQDRPASEDRGYISLFQLAMAIEAGETYRDKDYFDICYIDLFETSDTVLQLNYLEKEAANAGKKEGYRRSLHLGLIHAGRMLLLPKLAFEQRGFDWEKSFDNDQFRSEYQSAVDSFRASGEVGKSLLEQMEKVARRMDRDGDGSFSDEEIHRYLAQKIKVLLAGASL